MNPQDLTIEDYHINGVRKQSNYQKERRNCMHCGQQRHTKNNSPDDRKRHCKAYSITCNKCNKRGHYVSVCLQKQKLSSTPKADIQQVSGERSPVAEVSNVARFFALSANNSDKVPSNAKDVAIMVQEIRSTQEGPITTIPLPHHVHNKITGWMEEQPYQSPAILAQFSIDRQSYAELNLHMTKLSPGRNPGRTIPTPSISDTGAQWTVIPRSILGYMRVKPEKSRGYEFTITCRRRFTSHNYC